MNDSNSYLRNNSNLQSDKKTNNDVINEKKENRLFKKIPKILFLPLIFILATIYIYYLSKSFSYVENTSTNATSISLPRNLNDLRQVTTLLLSYKDQHFALVFSFFCSAYIYKQTFAIPGSALLNLLAGALFGVVFGFPLVCLLTAIGASNCYWLSRFFGRDFIVSKFSVRVKAMQDKMNENKHSQFFFLLFLRLFPMSPNWFLNMVSPILEINPLMFFVTVFIGLMPYNYICVETGSMLSTLKSMNDLISVSTTLKLFTIAIVAVLPSVALSWMKSKKKD